MKLIIAIELSPFQYATEEYESPNSTSHQLPEEWNEFWQKCLSDKNLGNIRAIRKGSFLVDIETIKDSELEEILKLELSEGKLEDYENRVSPLDGGIVVVGDNNLYIEPTCCGDIGNVKEWEKIVTSGLHGWTDLWIGHPWIFYKKENGFIDFSDYYDSNLEEIKELQTMIRISESEFQVEMGRLRNQHHDFEIRILKTLRRLGISNSEPISKLLTGND